MAACAFGTEEGTTPALVVAIRGSALQGSPGSRHAPLSSTEPETWQGEREDELFFGSVDEDTAGDGRSLWSTMPCRRTGPATQRGADLRGVRLRSTCRSPTTCHFANDQQPTTNDQGPATGNRQPATTDNSHNSPTHQPTNLPTTHNQPTTQPTNQPTNHTHQPHTNQTHTQPAAHNQPHTNHAPHTNNQQQQ